MFSYGRLQGAIKGWRESSRPGPWPERPRQLVDRQQMLQTHAPSFNRLQPRPATFSTSRPSPTPVNALHTTDSITMQTSTLGLDMTIASSNTRYDHFFPTIWCQSFYAFQRSKMNSFHNGGRSQVISISSWSHDRWFWLTIDFSFHFPTLKLTLASPAPTPYYQSRITTYGDIDHYQQRHPNFSPVYAEQDPPNIASVSTTNAVQPMIKCPDCGKMDGQGEDWQRCTCAWKWSTRWRPRLGDNDGVDGDRIGKWKNLFPGVCLITVGMSQLWSCTI